MTDEMLAMFIVLGMEALVIGGIAWLVLWGLYRFIHPLSESDKARRARRKRAKRKARKPVIIAIAFIIVLVIVYGS